jgi:hypothetical protein
MDILNKKINKLKTYVSLKKMSDMWKGHPSRHSQKQ